MKEAEPMFTTLEAAEMLEVTAARVRQMVIAGIIQAEKKGRDLLISKSQIEKAKGRKTKPGPKAAKKARKGGAK
jgi:excisionase family DNA binding protein